MKRIIDGRTCDHAVSTVGVSAWLTGMPDAGDGWWSVKERAKVMTTSSPPSTQHEKDLCLPVVSASTHGGTPAQQARLHTIPKHFLPICSNSKLNATKSKFAKKGNKCKAATPTAKVIENASRCPKLLNHIYQKHSEVVWNQICKLVASCLG